MPVQVEANVGGVVSFSESFKVDSVDGAEIGVGSKVFF
jgi:hypothetical protein